LLGNSPEQRSSEGENWFDQSLLGTQVFPSTLLQIFIDPSSNSVPIKPIFLEKHWGGGICTSPTPQVKPMNESFQNRNIFRLQATEKLD
jgi:hypothetical protein